MSQQCLAVSYLLQMSQHYLFPQSWSWFCLDMFQLYLSLSLWYREPLGLGDFLQGLSYLFTQQKSALCLSSGQMKDNALMT